MVPFSVACYKFVRFNIENKPQAYDFPQFRDFWIPALSSVVFYSIQTFFEKTFVSILMPYIKQCNSVEEKELRANKASKYLFKFIYYIGSVTWAFYIFMDQPWMPKLLGGSGTYSKAFDGFPYKEHAPGLKYYYLVLMGYHLGALISHFVTSKKNDFIEMGLHHILAVQLYGGSYILNLWEQGAIVVLIHDLSDITISICRALSQTIYQHLAAVLFISNMAVWVYTRMVVFPYLIYTNFISDADFGWNLTLPTICALLSCLFLLHCYWFMLFCKMVTNYAKTGKTEDI